MHFFSFFLFHVLMRVWWSRSSLDPSTLLMTPFLPFLKSPSCNLKPLRADLEIISYSWQLKVFSFFLENCAKDLALKRGIFPVQLGGRSWIFCCQNVVQPIFFGVRVHWKTVGNYEMTIRKILKCLIAHLNLQHSLWYLIIELDYFNCNYLSTKWLKHE